MFLKVQLASLGLSLVSPFRAHALFTLSWIALYTFSVFFFHLFHSLELSDLYLFRVGCFCSFLFFFLSLVFFLTSPSFCLSFCSIFYLFSSTALTFPSFYPPPPSLHRTFSEYFTVHSFNSLSYSLPLYCVRTRI